MQFELPEGFLVVSFGSTVTILLIVTVMDYQLGNYGADVLSSSL